MLIINSTQTAQEFFTSTKNQQKFCPVLDMVSKEFTEDLFWIKDTTVHTLPAKTDSNEPCPYSIGKKYKKCCGLH